MPMLFFKNLQQYKNVIHGVLERKDGSVNPLSNPKTEENVLKALKEVGYEGAAVSNLVFAEQVHGTEVHFCGDTGGYIKLNADGLITEIPGQILVVKTADCVPILIYDPVQNRVAAVHAGRKGLLKGIIKNALTVLESRGKDLIIGLGPHIRKCCYYFDLTQVVFDQLAMAGVKKENIEDCGVCTFCSANDFFSARKKESQRFGTFIGLR